MSWLKSSILLFSSASIMLKIERIVFFPLQKDAMPHWLNRKKAILSYLFCQRIIQQKIGMYQQCIERTRAGLVVVVMAAKYLARSCEQQAAFIKIIIKLSIFYFPAVPWLVRYLIEIQNMGSPLALLSLHPHSDC